MNSNTICNTMVFTCSSSGIVHSSGKSVTFTRDAPGRIARSTDPVGNERRYVYYDTAGSLAYAPDHGRWTFSIRWTSAWCAISMTTTA